MLASLSEGYFLAEGYNRKEELYLKVGIIYKGRCIIGCKAVCTVVQYNTYSTFNLRVVFFTVIMRIRCVD